MDGIFVVIVIWLIGFSFTVGMWAHRYPTASWFGIPLLLLFWPCALGQLVDESMSGPHV